LFAVEREHVLVRKFVRIEGALPLFVGIAGSTDVEFGGARNGSLLERENIIARGGPRDRRKKRKAFNTEGTEGGAQRTQRREAARLTFFPG